MEPLLAFDCDPTLYHVEPHNQGHINDTFYVRHLDSHHVDYVLQRINHAIFKDVPALMSNLDKITEHVARCAEKRGDNPNISALRLKKTRDDKSYVCDSNGHYWRLYYAIPNAKTINTVSDEKTAEAGAFAFGQFVKDLSSLDVNEITATIPHFLDLEHRYQQLNEACKKDLLARYDSISNELQAVLKKTRDLIELMGKQANLPIRITHNDTKFNNVLFSDNWEPVCVIDLDTTMPGTVLHDFSDAIRSAAHSCPEDSEDLGLAVINPTLFKAIYQGFLRGFGDMLTELERDLMLQCSHLMPLMLSLRFYADYLQGDPYFKAQHKFQNLHRARVQAALANDLIARQVELSELVGA